MHKRMLILLAALLVALAAPALAEEARDITKECTIKMNGYNFINKPMTDRYYDTHYQLRKGVVLEVESKGETISGVFIQHHDRPAGLEIQIEKDGQWQVVGEGSCKYLTEWFPVPQGVTKLRIASVGDQRLFINELYIYGEGERPARVHSWEDLEKADLMLLVAHPDDDLLWFCGLLPTYAGDRDLEVQVAYLVPSTPRRRLELLDGLWTCGVEDYPLFANMRDNRADTLSGQYKLWSKKVVLDRVVGLVRQVKPDVIVTQDVNGEYGHGAHRVVADVTMLAVEQAADATCFPDSALRYGTWQIKKCYLHLYPENQITMDWHQPLEAFDGETSYEVACRALECHKSQTLRGWEMADGDKLHNDLFGLYYSAVGPDVAGNDFMENIVK